MAYKKHAAEIADNVRGFQQDDYESLTDYEHIIRSKNMYIGSCKRDVRDVYMLRMDKAIKTVTELPQGISGLFSEAVANAADAMNKSIEEGVYPGPIVIDVDETTISVSNSGLPIPVVVHEKTGLYLPEMLVVTAKAGSNFDEDSEEEIKHHKKKRSGAGANGLGMTLIGLFSKFCSLEVADSINKKYFYQEWTDGLKEDKSKQVVKDYRERTSYVKITFTLNLRRFGYKLDDVFPDDTLSILKFIAAYTSFTCKTRVIFNKVTMDYSSPLKFSDLFQNPICLSDMNDFVTSEESSDDVLSDNSEENDNKTKIVDRILHYQWDEDADIILDKKTLVETSESNLHVPNVEVVIWDAPNEGVTYGLCNSISNINGGVHVKAVVEAISEHIVSSLNNRKDKEETRSKKNEKKDKKEIEADRIDRSRATYIAKRIVSHLGIIVSVRVIKPQWDGQTKTELKGFENENGKSGKLRIELTKEQKKKILRWRGVLLVNSTIKTELMNKSINNLKRMDSVNFKGEPAHFAGTDRSMEAIGIACEGDSAEGYLNYVRGATPQGADTIGTYLIGGKFKNAIKGNKTELVGKGFVELVSMLNLQGGMDYRQMKDRKKLNYGAGFIIMADADVDGLHITMLLISFFAHYFPTFLEAGLISLWRSKIIMAKKGKECITFYTEQEYEDWLKKHHSKGWKISYYKGLGSNTKEDAIRDALNYRVDRLVVDRESFDYVMKTMGNSKGDSLWRKNWILAFDKNRRPVEPDGDKVLLKNFINDEFIRYSVHTLLRHIATRDGFKDTQRKIIHTASMIWKWFELCTEAHKKRVLIFAAKVMDFTHYHHGDLSKVQMKMAQTFVGAPPIPFFVDDGQFGTRIKGGKDMAAARYPCTYPTKILKYIIKKEDKCILKYRMEDGERVEPLLYYPTVCLPVIQGHVAIATGWSSFIPSHHPLDVVEWLKRRAMGKRTFEPQPWFRNFTGKVRIVNKSVQSSSSSSSDDDGDDDKKDKPVDDSFKSTRRLKTYGTYEMQKNGDILVTELPVGVWTKSYKKDILHKKLVKNNLIKGFKCYSDTDKVSILIQGVTFRGKKDILKNLRLVKTVGLGNMVLLNDELVPIRFKTVSDILEDFYIWRVKAYEMKLLCDVRTYEKELIRIVNLIKYINAVKDGALLIFDEIESGGITKKVPRDEDAILDDIERLGLDSDIYLSSKVSDRHYSKASMNRLLKEKTRVETALRTCKTIEPTNLMLGDLDAFEQAWIKFYPDDQ